MVKVQATKSRSSGKKGGRRNVMISGAPILSVEGSLQSFIGTFTDITYRKKIEEALREGEKNFRSLAENANDGILIAVGDGRHVYANKRAAKITGYSVSELYKTTIRDLAHPDEFEKRKRRYKKIIAGKPFQIQYETMIIRKDGKAVPIEVASAIDRYVPLEFKVKIAIFFYALRADAG